MYIWSRRLDFHGHDLSRARITAFGTKDEVSVTVEYAVKSEVRLKINRKDWDKLVESVTPREAKPSPITPPFQDVPNVRYNDIQLPDFDA